MIKKIGPYGEQYYILRSELSTAQEVTNVVAVTQQVNIMTLGDVIEQAIVAANEPLKEELIDRIEKISGEIASIRQLNEGVELKK